MQTADAVVVRDELATIPTLIALARRARRVVAANLAIAATFIAVLVAWDLIGHLPLNLGVAGHEGSTILVGLNRLRLLRNTAMATSLKAPCSPGLIVAASYLPLLSHARDAALLQTSWNCATAPRTAEEPVNWTSPEARPLQ